jgi:MFS family permease
MNSAGTELQVARDRPLLSRLHAAQSGGLLAGALVATAAAAARLPLAIHFTLVAALGGGAALTACTQLPGGPPARPVPVWVPPQRRLVRLGVVAFCVFMIDGGATYWLAVELRTEHDAPDAVAAAAFALFTAAMAVTRLGGDRACARLGRVRVVRWCGSLAAAGALLVVLAPSAEPAIAGWVAVGAGLAVLTPTVLGAASGRPGTGPPGTAIATVTALGYLGSFAGPPLIGAVADLVGLSLALTLLVVAAAAAVVIAPAALRDPVGGESR